MTETRLERFDRDWSNIRDDRKARGFDSMPAERKASELPVGITEGKYWPSDGYGVTYLSKSNPSSGYIDFPIVIHEDGLGYTLEEELSPSEDSLAILLPLINPEIRYSLNSGTIVSPGLLVKYNDGILAIGVDIEGSTEEEVLLEIDAQEQGFLNSGMASAYEPYFGSFTPPLKKIRIVQVSSTQAAGEYRLVEA